MSNKVLSGYGRIRVNDKYYIALNYKVTLMRVREYRTNKAVYTCRYVDQASLMEVISLYKDYKSWQNTDIDCKGI